MVDLLGAPPCHEILYVKKDAHARADLAEALLDELAHILAERPSICRQGPIGGSRYEQEASVTASTERMRVCAEMSWHCGSNSRSGS
eukprot:152592-Prymnesium_polylepis.1